MGRVAAGEAKNRKQKGMGMGEGGKTRADVGEPLELVWGGLAVT